MGGDGARAATICGVESGDFAVLGELVLGEFANLRSLACVRSAVKKNRRFSYLRCLQERVDSIMVVILRSLSIGHQAVFREG